MNLCIEKPTLLIQSLGLNDCGVAPVGALVAQKGNRVGERRIGRGWSWGNNWKIAKEKEREGESNDLHMVSCWSLNTVTIYICWGLLGLISRTQL